MPTTPYGCKKEISHFTCRRAPYLEMNFADMVGTRSHIVDNVYTLYKVQLKMLQTFESLHLWLLSIQVFFQKVFWVAHNMEIDQSVIFLIMLFFY